MYYNARNCNDALFATGDNSPFANTNTPQFNTLVVGDSVSVIPANAFYNRSSISNVQIGSNVQTIGSSAFRDCSGINQLTIPDGVLSIGDNAFYGCSGIDSLFINSSVQAIGLGAFVGCTGLKFLFYNSRNCNNGTFPIGTASPFYNTPLFNTLVIGDSVETIPANAFYNRSNIINLQIGTNVQIIGNNAFRGCSGIHQLVIPENITSIGNSAFYGCSGFSQLIIPDGVTSIGDNAFYDCSYIDSLHIGNGLTAIGNYVFQGCSNIQNLVIPNNIVSIGNNAFYGCTGIVNVTLGSGVVSIGSNAFYGCTGIDNISFGGSVMSIGNSAFQGCTGFSKLLLPESVTSIGNDAFYGCSNVDSLYIDCNVQSIGTGAFSGCTGLKYMYYNARNCNDALFATGNNAPFANTNTPLFNTLVVGDSVNVIPANAFYNRSSISNVQIGPNVQTIGSSAFRGCSGINQLIIPNGVSNIGDNAFYGCSGIGSLHIGGGITAIGNGVFQGCSNIQNLVIPDNIASIGNNAFYGCTGIVNVTLGSGVVSIGSNAFYGCTGIDNISFGGSVMSIGNSAFQGCTGVSKLILPESVTSIGSSAFYGCSNIDSLYIGSNVQTIGGGAFGGCTGLIWLNYNAPSLPAQGFYGCTQLATLILGSAVQSIGNEAFFDCDNLLTANINTPQIGRKAFADCDRLVTVTLGDNVSTLSREAFSGCFRLQSVTFGTGIDSIPSVVFNGCVRLENMQLSSGLRHIGDSAFYGCSLIHDIVLPEGLNAIGNHAFSGCGAISGMLEFPSTITSIGDYAFRNNGTITELRMNGINPPTIYANTFASVSNSTPVSVPCGSVLNYYTTNYWENFSTIVEAPPYKLTVGTNNETMGSAAVSQQPTCSNHSAIIQATAETGFHFIQWNDGNGTNPRTVNMTQDSSFTAIFVPNNSQVTVVPNDPLMGTTSGTGTYGWNAPVTMTATAYDGYHFLKWNDGNTQNPRYMAAVRDTTFTAIFVSNVSTITVGNANPDWGNVSGSGVYYYMNLVSLTATPMYGYHFSRWNDGNTQNPRTITVIQDSSFTAYFAVNTYSIVGTSNSTAMGSVTGGGTYTYLHEMSLTATPAFGYHFVQWNDQNTDNPRTITVTRDSAFTAQFAANSYTITAEPNDPTMGSAYGSGTYNFNATATLTAVAEYGYHFTQWSDGVTDNPRTITVQNSATYTAQFEINSYILTVQSSNPAIGTTSGGGSYNYLTPVNISANPNAGYHFTQWSDGNTDNPRLVTVTQNATYTAQFAINSYAVGVTCNNTSMGAVSGSGTYNHNSTATLSATAYYGYHFVQWQDGNTENPRCVVVTDSAQFTAQFDYNSYLVTANSSNVTLGSATGGGSYNYLSQVALTAVAVPHYHFTMWNDSIEDNPRTIIVTRDTMFTAHFAIDRHTIGVNSADATMGSASGSDTVNYNTAVWITATANYGYHFVQWNDGNSSNPRRVVVSQDTVFSASFAPNQYNVTTSVNNTTMGSVTAGGTYTYLTPLTLTATANYGYHFTGWSDGVTENPRSFTLTQDTSFTAVFAVNQYYVTLVSNDSTLGTVQGGGEYNYLSQVTITATAAPHSHFVQWSDGNTTNPRLLTLTCDTSFTAIFEGDQQFQITVNANDTTMGSVGGSGMYYLGETVSITATANEHYYFSQWSDGVTSNPRVVTVIGDASYTAVFEPVMYTLTVAANDYSMGQVTGGGSYAYGTVVTIEARAFDDYRFVRWSDGDTAAVRTVTVMEDLRLEATFERKHPDGIDDVDVMSYKVYVQNGHIVVEGLENHREARVTVFDVAGRRRSLTETFPTGVYMVKIGRWAKKVVVM